MKLVEQVRVLLLAITCLCATVNVNAWGRNGHRFTCAIAQGLLTESAHSAVIELLPPSAGGYLSNVCSWADAVRFTKEWAWSTPLHFVDTPDFACNYNFSRDCHYGTHQKFCIVAGINNYTSQLLGRSVQDKNLQSRLHQSYNLTEALLMLSHLLGDIHQPLHAGFTSDRGGNTIHLTWFGRRENLHEVWDDGIIGHAIYKVYQTPENMVESIAKKVSGEWLPEVSQWATCEAQKVACPGSYVVGTVRNACRWAYRNATPGSHLADGYFETRLPIVEKEIAKGGVRLAAILNRIFAKNAPLVANQ